VENENQKLDTTKGKLQNYYSINQFKISKEHIISIDEVADNQLSPEEVARLYKK